MKNTLQKYNIKGKDASELREKISKSHEFNLFYELVKDKSGNIGLS